MIRAIADRLTAGAQPANTPPTPDSMLADSQDWGDIPHTPWSTAQACLHDTDDAAAHPAVQQADEDLRFPAAYYVALAAALLGSALAAVWWPWGWMPTP